MLELLELWSVELKGLVEELMKLEPEALQCAKLKGISPLVDYHQLAHPCMIPEGEDERHEA